MTSDVWRYSDLPTQPSNDAGDQDRLCSLDLFRGVVMFFLIAEATGLYDLLTDAGTRGAAFLAIGKQFQHHP